MELNYKSWHYSRWLIPFIIIASLIIIINPIASADILIIGGILFILGALILEERLLLIFLLIRPAVDYWSSAEFGSIFGVSLNLNAFLAFLFLLWSSVMLIIHSEKIKALPLKIIFPITTLFFLITAIYSVDTTTTVIEVIKFSNLGLMLFISYIFVSSRIINAKEILITIAFSAVIPIAVALWQLVSGTGLDTFGIRGRLYGTLGHPNVFSFLLLFIFMLHTQYSTIVPAEFWKKRKELKIFVYILLLVLLALTYTRIAFVGLAVFLVIIGLIKYRKMLIIVTITAVSFYALIPVANTILIKYANTNLESYTIIHRLTTRNQDADSITWRSSLIKESLPIIYKEPLMGYGYGTFPLVWEEQRALDHIWDDSSEAHNDYLRMLMEGGLIGIALYGLLLLKLLITSTKPLFKSVEKRYEYMYFFAWVLIFGGMGLTDNMLSHTPVMWLTFAWWGAVLANMKIERKHINFLTDEKK
ncbi:MAG: O-antigen ligase family protein [Patescibacteria group bacterium]